MAPVTRTSDHTKPPSWRGCAPSTRASAKVRRRSVKPSVSSSAVALMARASAKESSTLVSPDRSTAVSVDAMTRRDVHDVGDAGGRAEGRAQPGRDRRRGRAVGVDQELPDGGIAGPRRDVGRVGHEEAVAGSGGELPGDAGVVERHRDELAGAPVLEPQPQQVAGVQLEVAHGLLADQDGVRLPGQDGHELAGRAAGEVGVLEPGGVGDRGRPDAVQVLQVRAHVGESVLQRFDRADPRYPGDCLGQGRAARACRGIR